MLVRLSTGSTLPTGTLPQLNRQSLGGRQDTIMNCTRSIIVLSVLVVSIVLAQTQDLPRTLTLSVNAQSAISRQLGRWQYADIRIPTYDGEGREYGEKYADLISGDFDGDECIDYAGIFELLDSANTPLRLVALLCRDSSYQCQVLDQGDRDIPTVVHLVKKGTVERDMESGETYKHPYGAIGWGYYEKAGGTYYYRGGRFHYISTSD